MQTRTTRLTTILNQLLLPFTSHLTSLRPRLPRYAHLRPPTPTYAYLPPAYLYLPPLSCLLPPPSSLVPPPPPPPPPSLQPQPGIEDLPLFNYTVTSGAGSGERHPPVLLLPSTHNNAPLLTSPQTSTSRQRQHPYRPSPTACKCH